VDFSRASHVAQRSASLARRQQASKCKLSVIAASSAGRCYAIAFMVVGPRPSFEKQQFHSGCRGRARRYDVVLHIERFSLWYARVNG
jgi:hypothetical protein